MQNECTREHILSWLCGNEFATDFYNSLWTVGQAWDDLIDKDKPMTNEAIHNAFIQALVLSRDNPFYKSYADKLDVVVTLAINDWLDSVRWEDEKNEAGLELGYSLRLSMTNILIYSSLLLGGWDHMRQVSIEVRQMLLDTEDLNEYKANYCA